MFRPLVVAAAVTAALALSAPALSDTVHVRVEGLSATLFDGDVETSVHEVDGHTCDGTNGGANDDPAPTMIGALDDAGLDWDGTWFEGFEDFSVDRIGPDAADLATNRFWGLVLNGEATQVGGCQQHVEDGDEVLFAYDLFSKAHVLELRSEQNVAAVGTGVVYQVRDAASGAPIAGATVGGKATDASGRVTLFYSSAGTHSVKAERSDSIRSNAFTTCIYFPSAGGCGFAAAATPPPPPPPEVGPFLPPAAAAPACSSITLVSGKLRVGKRNRVEVEVLRGAVPVVGVQVRFRARGVNVRRVTDAGGRVSLVLRPHVAGALRVGIYGEIRRCGVEPLRVARG